MEIDQEAAVRAFLAEMDGAQWDAAQVERVVMRMAPDARFRVVAWNDPIVGRDAIRAELLRQGSLIRDLHIEILTIGSVGPVVFTERTDSMVWRGTRITSHIAGVFEVDAEGKIAAWRDYLDTRELSVQLEQA